MPLGFWFKINFLDHQDSNDFMIYSKKGSLAGKNFVASGVASGRPNSIGVVLLAAIGAPFGLQVPFPR